MKTNTYLSACITEAQSSPLRSRHGAILVRGGKVLSRGHNGPLARFGDDDSGPLSCHAEMAAIYHALAPNERGGLGKKKMREEISPTLLQEYVQSRCDAATLKENNEQRRAGAQVAEWEIKPRMCVGEWVEEEGEMEEGGEEEGSWGSSSSQRQSQEVQRVRQIRSVRQQHVKSSHDSSISSTSESSNCSIDCSIDEDDHTFNPAVSKPTRVSVPYSTAVPRRARSGLEGADLYVCRIGNGPRDGLSPFPDSDTSSPDTSPLPSPSPSTGSLHDELSPDWKLEVLDNCPATESPPYPILASRPCYHCISLMVSVGIKRVFWTSSTGAWEGGKVRDILDAIQRGDEADKGVLFMTRFEILKRREKLLRQQ
ncbi:hypothetical protein BT63DRAFT_148944 [Microthyrium microscopicum]|uniref:CMP/dCMP-type deaminase domain-containing protein n=1 Tax=Microthyrium microscopicum TaxID=703497 RepID=A0A6A6ULR5_9PEZI|nr:hypothetical protein BT63DRAFT_148944 [Microthyrium microscopicum]